MYAAEKKLQKVGRPITRWKVKSGSEMGLFIAPFRNRLLSKAWLLLQHLAMEYEYQFLSLTEHQQSVQCSEGRPSAEVGPSGSQVGPLHRVWRSCSYSAHLHVCPHCSLVRMRLVHHWELWSHPWRLSKVSLIETRVYKVEIVSANIIVQWKKKWKAKYNSKGGHLKLMITCFNLPNSVNIISGL